MQKSECRMQNQAGLDGVRCSALAFCILHSDFRIPARPVTQNTPSIPRVARPLRPR
jgi:hypothetical protein